MADVIIGGQTWSVSLPNFKTLRAAWRHIAAIQGSTDPMDSVAAILGIVSVGASTSVTPDELEARLTPREMQGLRAFLDALMVESGLAPEKGDPGQSDLGEGTPAEAVASPSTATSTSSSAPSWPEPAALTGTWLKRPGISDVTAP
ncbi:MAG TPA: hypothetical protein VME40_12835 [Caulobacteraceae bacterium]|nr:hypothetical protein [Caulobacteraceae bacterium]